jgi:hypothetical protein
VCEFFNSFAFHYPPVSRARCGESANIFANALFSRPNYSFGSNPYWWTYSHRETDDDTLRFFQMCPKYLEVCDGLALMGELFVMFIF